VPSSAVSGQVIFADQTLDTCATLTTPYVGTPSSYVDRRTYPLYANCIACNDLVNSRWATMVRCDNPAITAYSNRFNVGDFSVNDIVADDTVYNQPPFYTYRITSISTDSANFPQRFINATGLSTCPSDTTTTTTTKIPVSTTTTTTEGCVDCYVYEYINTTGNLISLNGTLCYGGIYSINVPASGEGSTSCLRQYSQSQIDAYAAVGLTLTQGITSCGNSCIPPTTTSTTTLATTTTTTTPAPTLEWYTITSCAANATDTSTSYPVDTYNINDRVGANGFLWKVTGITNYNPGGSNFELSTTGLSGCPFNGCIKWTNEFDYDQEVTCTDPFTSVTSSGTDVYFKLTASLFELDGVTPKDAPLGGVIITFGVSTSGSCSTGGGGTYVVTIPEFTNSVIAEYQQTNYSECGYGCGYNTFTPESLLYTNYIYVNECPA
jgi:hypothetical protein